MAKSLLLADAISMKTHVLSGARFVIGDDTV